MVNYLAWLVSGALVGLLATRVTHRRKSILWINILVGSLSTFVFGFLFLPVLDIDTTYFSIPGLLAALTAGCVALFAINIKYREHTTKNAVILREWDQVLSKITARWSKITTEDAEWIEGDHNRFIQILQKRYNISKAEAEDQIQHYLSAVIHEKSWGSLSHSSNREQDTAPDHNHTPG